MKSQKKLLIFTAFLALVISSCSIKSGRVSSSSFNSSSFIPSSSNISSSSTITSSSFPDVFSSSSSSNSQRSSSSNIPSSSSSSSNLPSSSSSSLIPSSSSVPSSSSIPSSSNSSASSEPSSSSIPSSSSVSSEPSSSSVPSSSSSSAFSEPSSSSEPSSIPSSLHEHTFSDTWTYDNNYHWHASTCGHDVTTKKEPHNYKDTVTNPTYESGGYTTHTCLTCGYSYTDNQTSPLEHYFAQNWSIDEEKGTHYHACLDAGYGDLRQDEAAHSYTDTVVAATYEAGGYTKHQCSICGYSYTDKQTNKLEHHYAWAWSVDIEKGTHYHACTDAGYEDLRGGEEKHSYYTEVTEPTFEHGGWTTYICSVCGTRYATSETPALEHTYASEWSVDESKGTHYHACLDAGYSKLRKDEATHTYVTTTIKPTFEEQGYKKHECSVCGYFYKDTFTKQLEHHYSNEWSVDVEKGTHYHACTDAGYEDLRKDEVAHVNETTVVDPTVTEDGYAYDVCSICGYRSPNRFSGSSAGTYDVLQFAVNKDDPTTCSVYGTRTGLEGDIIIPAYYNGMEVTSLGDDSAFFACPDLHSVTFTDHIKRIGHDAFLGTSCAIYYYGSLENWLSLSGKRYIKGAVYLYLDGSETETTSITVPDTITNIEPYAFYYCRNVEYITMNGTYGGQKLENSDFKGCRSLKTLNINTSLIPEGTEEENGYKKILYTSGTNTTIRLTGTDPIPKYSFNSYPYAINYRGTFEEWLNLEGKQYLNDVDRMIGQFSYFTSISGTIPEGTTSIGDYAFYHVTNLKRITMPDSVISIGEKAFYGCSGLEGVSFSNTIESIGKEAFYNCNILPEITIPDSVTSIGDKCFANCKSITSLDVPSGVEALGDEVCSTCSLLETVQISEGLTAIGDKAFYNCKALKTINIPRSVQTMGEDVFTNCPLENVSCPSRFADCLPKTKLKDLTLYDGGVSGDAFKNCTTLEKLTLLDGVTSLGDRAFYGCTSLTDVTLSEDLISIGDFCFNDCYDISYLIIPKSVEEIKSVAFYDCIIDYLSVDVSYLKMNEETLISNLRDSFVNIKTLNITGEGRLGPKAVSSITTLQNAIINEGITEIGSAAFASCSSLKSVVIPSTVTSIGTNAFYGCSSELEIYYHGSLEQWLNLAGRSQLYGKFHLFLNGNDIETTDIVIPSSCTSIPSSAFQNCTNLRSITFADNVTALGANAFAGCSSLRINYYGSTLNWFNLSDKSSLVNYDVHLYLDGSESETTNLVLPDYITDINEAIFYGCDNIETVTLHRDVSNVDPGINVQLPALTAFVVDANNPNFSAVDGVLFNKNQTTLVMYPTNKSTSEYTVPLSVTTINPSAFYGCPLIEQVNLSANVTSADYAFIGCTSLSSIIVDNNNPYLRTYDDALYSKDLSKLIYYPTAKRDGQFIVPAEVREIAAYAFSGDTTHLSKIWLTTNITSINGWAFIGLTENTEIEYMGTVEQLNGVIKKGWLGYKSGVTQIKCTDGYWKL